MKHLTTLFLIVAALGCEKVPSKLDQSTGAITGGPGGASGNSEALARLEARVRLLEEAAKVKLAPDGKTDLPVAERLQRVEATLVRYNEPLDFLAQVYAQQKAQQEAKAAGEHDPEAVFAVDVAPAIAAGQLEGPAQAPVTIVKAFDFACPYCEKLNAPLHELVKEYGGKVRVVYMNLVVHPDTAMTAHLYSCAAAKQQKYVAWKDAFWDKGFGGYRASGGRDSSTMGEEAILKFSADLGLDIQRLKADANSSDCKQRVATDEAELRKFRVSGTPGLFINGTFVNGAIPKEVFKQMIDEKLKLVDASGAGAAYYDKEIMAKGAKQFRSKKDAQAEKGG